MRNLTSSDGFSECNEPAGRKVDVRHFTPSNNAEQLKLDHLMETGFQWDEAVTLMNLRERLYENAEMKQRIKDNYRMQFVKWLYEQGLLHEG